MPTLVLGLLALSAGAYRYIHNLIKQELTASMLATTDKTAETIRDFSVIDIQNIYRHRILHEKYPDIFKDIYAANRHREYHTVRERGSKYFIFVGNIADRPHFKSIMSGGTAQITPPLVSRTTSIPTIFLVAPIKDDTGRPQDTGPGISDVNMKNLFQPLFTTKTKGIGLGLTVCKNLTEANGGRIDVESEIGKGTTFRVVLPVTGRSI